MPAHACFTPDPIKGALPVAKAPEIRNDVLEFFKAKRLPVLLKQTSTGSIPVVLVNAVNGHLLSEYFANSIGFIAQHQPHWNMDHGLMRFGKVLSDADAPGSRTYDEIHQTGISWFEIESNTKRRNPVETNLIYDEQRIEVSYLVTPEQQARMAYYMTARRSALFRVPYQFHGKASNLSFPNTFRNGVEHCFIYSKATNLEALHAESAAMMQRLGIQAAEFVERPKVKEFLQTAKNYLLSLQPTFTDADATTFHHAMLGDAVVGGQKIAALIQAELPPNLNSTQQLELLNWLVAYDSIGQFRALRGELQITDDFSFRDMHRRTPTAILIYDPDPAAFGKFLDGSYTSYGHQGRWEQNDQEVVALPAKS